MPAKTYERLSREEELLSQAVFTEDQVIRGL